VVAVPQGDNHNDRRQREQKDFPALFCTIQIHKYGEQPMASGEFSASPFFILHSSDKNLSFSLLWIGGLSFYGKSSSLC
jgi:hypothetical protein